ncbi:class I SAM-dependent methyltransferase [bacterium]|nr:class I SAM-dependent methyltransferase [bacterium]
MKRLSRTFFPGFRIVDLGGGVGQWLEAFCKRGFKLGYLVDLEFEMVFQSKKRWQSQADVESLMGMVGNSENIPIRSQTIDLVVSRNSMHMWSDLRKSWEEIARILNLGGTAFIGRGYGPDLNGAIRESVKTNRKKMLEELGNKSAEPPSPPCEEVSRVCSSAGLEVREVIPDGKCYWIFAEKKTILRPEL